MHFVYQPEGVSAEDAKRWPFNPGKLMSPEAEAIERHTGMTFGQWSAAVLEGSMLATHGLLFVLLKRADPTLKWEAVQFCMDEIDFDLDPDESAKAIASLEGKAAAGEITSEEQAALDELRSRVDAGSGEVPKAPESSSEPATSGSSPTS